MEQSQWLDSGGGLAGLEMPCKTPGWFGLLLP